MNYLNYYLICYFGRLNCYTVLPLNDITKYSDELKYHILKLLCKMVSL